MTFTAIIIVAEKNINRDFYFARIIEFYGEEVIPLNKNESEYDIIAYYFSNIDFKENDIVLIVFTDLYFADNLNNLDAIVPTSKTIRHTSSNAVAIKI